MYTGVYTALYFILNDCLLSAIVITVPTFNYHCIENISDPEGIRVISALTSRAMLPCSLLFSSPHREIRRCNVEQRGDSEGIGHGPP
jgi:hypothetical protein